MKETSTQAPHTGCSDSGGIKAIFLCVCVCDGTGSKMKVLFQKYILNNQTNSLHHMVQLQSPEAPDQLETNSHVFLCFVKTAECDKTRADKAVDVHVFRSARSNLQKLTRLE